MDENAPKPQTQVCPYASASTAIHFRTYEPALFLPGCNKWRCKVCGPERRRKLCYRIIDAHPERFLTLTIAPLPEETPRETYDRARRKIPELFRTLNKIYGRKTEYFRIMEIHRSGYPHFHFLTRGPFWPKPRIVEIWKKLTGSYIVDIRRLKFGEATRARYVTKYLAKTVCGDMSITKQPYCTSRGFWLPPSKGESPSEFQGWDQDYRNSWQGSVDGLKEHYSFLQRGKRSWWMLGQDDRMPIPPLFQWDLDPDLPPETDE